MEATVTSCVKAKEVNGKPVYKVTLSDGRSGESFAKEIPTGTKEADLAIEESQYGLKIKMKGGGAFGGAAKPRVGNESFALSYSKDWCIAQLNKGLPVKTDDVLKIADTFYTWLENKKK